MKCDICGIEYKVYYPEFRELEQQCTCKLLSEKNEISLDITDEIVELELNEIIKILDFLKKNGFKKFYFDGYNASISVIKLIDKK